MHNFTLRFSISREQMTAGLNTAETSGKRFRTDTPTQTAILSDPKALCLEKNT